MVLGLSEGGLIAGPLRTPLYVGLHTQAKGGVQHRAERNAQECVGRVQGGGLEQQLVRGEGTIVVQVRPHADIVQAGTTHGEVHGDQVAFLHGGRAATGTVHVALRTIRARGVDATEHQAQQPIPTAVALCGRFATGRDQGTAQVHGHGACDHEHVRSVAVLHGQGHIVGPVATVGMYGRLVTADVPIPEVPGPGSWCVQALVQELHRAVTAEGGHDIEVRDRWGWVGKHDQAIVLCLTVLHRTAGRGQRGQVIVRQHPDPQRRVQGRGGRHQYLVRGAHDLIGRQDQLAGGERAAVVPVHPATHPMGRGGACDDADVHQGAHVHRVQAAGSVHMAFRFRGPRWVGGPGVGRFDDPDPGDAVRGGRYAGRDRPGAVHVHHDSTRRRDLSAPEGVRGDQGHVVGPIGQVRMGGMLRRIGGAIAEVPGPARGPVKGEVGEGDLSIARARWIHAERDRRRQWHRRPGHADVRPVEMTDQAAEVGTAQVQGIGGTMQHALESGRRVPELRVLRRGPIGETGLDHHVRDAVPDEWNVQYMVVPACCIRVVGGSPMRGEPGDPVGTERTRGGGSQTQLKTLQYRTGRTEHIEPDAFDGALVHPGGLHLIRPDQDLMPGTVQDVPVRRREPVRQVRGGACPELDRLLCADREEQECGRADEQAPEGGRHVRFTKG